MGYKQALKHNGLSGRLPKTVKILKPITKSIYPYIKKEQDALNEQIASKHPYGFDKSIGLPKNYPQPEELIKTIQPVDLDEYIEKKISEIIPKEVKVETDNEFLKQLKLNEIELRKKYFKEVLKKEEQKVVQDYEYIEKIEKKEKKDDMVFVEKFRNTLQVKKDFVLPTIKNIQKFIPDENNKAYPMVRPLTPKELEFEEVKEEVELLEKRKTKEITKMNLLQDLIKQLDGFILNEHQLNLKIEEVFESNEETAYVDEEGNMKHADIMKNFSTIKENRLLSELDDSLFDYDKEESTVKFEHLVKYLDENKS
ncbi:uncharacterized protein HGUI_00881 [Hanseniaspora guilliermondii]|uniref:Uncharacterized protein n=1 Tax=Hanseniaspora guilliermondii TaxID=56406 RepID=A0A1L0CJZ3_9ASCO|nr:uncharacterized protein HGUI_00881 [Hanseniaspora guilliermondii]